MAEKQRIHGETYPVDEDFMAALAEMPQASGIALGFDRLGMLAAGSGTPISIAGRSTGAPSPVPSMPSMLIQDYHLFLVPGMIRASGVEAPLQFFQHVPWPGPGAWRCLPREWLEEILTSLLACDVVGLQTWPRCRLVHRCVRPLCWRRG